MTIRAAVLLIVAASLAAVPAAATAAPACTAQASGDPMAQNSNLELRVACDTAITNGSLSIGMNRGADPKDVAAPTYTGTPGSLSCSGQPQSPGGKYAGVIGCTGSLPAQTQVQIGALVGPGPCGQPAFTAQLGVQFGDGQQLGPQDFPPIVDCPSGGGDGGGGPQDPGPGQNFDPGGVFQGGAQGLPSKATVGKARSGLKFTMKLGVKGHVTVTIEVNKKVVGSYTRAITGGRTHLKARLSASAARKLKGHRTKAKVHVEVKPNAQAEGFSTHGRRYFSLTLTG